MVFDVAVPDVAMVQFKVLDKDFHNEDFIGQVCIPFNSLQQVLTYERRMCVSVAAIWTRICAC